MTGESTPTVRRWTGTGPEDDGLASLLSAYHLATEAEKGVEVAGIPQLPARYRAEVLDPRSAFVDHAVLVCLVRGTAVGCVVVVTADDGSCEIKRLWTDVSVRGTGVGSRLVRAALDHAAEQGADTVRLSVWSWRTDAIGLYERFGFAVVDSWDERDRLLCMERRL